MKYLVRKTSILSSNGFTCVLSIELAVLQQLRGQLDLIIELEDGEEEWSTCPEFSSQNGDASDNKCSSCNCFYCINSASDSLTQCNHAVGEEIADEESTSSEELQDMQTGCSCIVSRNSTLVAARPAKETGNPKFTGVTIDTTIAAPVDTDPPLSEIKLAEEIKILHNPNAANEAETTALQQEATGMQLDSRVQFELNCSADETITDASRKKKANCCGVKNSSPPPNAQEEVMPTKSQSPVSLRKIYNDDLLPDAQLYRILTKPCVPQIDMSVVRRNLMLVKAHRHPAQIQLDLQRLEAAGVCRTDEILSRRAISSYQASLQNANGDKPESVTKPIYPEWLNFKVRVKKPLADVRWAAYVHLKSQLRVKEQKNGQSTKGSVVKLSQKYNPEFIDSWTQSVTVAVKNRAVVADIVSSAFPRLGLDHRADFLFTINCFAGDSRSVKMPALSNPLEVFESTPVRKLYRLMADEIYVNGNKLDWFRDFPDQFKATSETEEQKTEENETEEQKTEKNETEEQTTEENKTEEQKTEEEL